MFHRIVQANDGSENAFTALRAAIDLSLLTKASLDVLFIEDLGTHGGLETGDVDEQRHISHRRAIAERVAGRHDVAIRTHVLVGHPVQQTVQFIEENKADLLVIGAAEHANLWELLFGRRSDRMTQEVSCSVLVVRAEGHEFL